MNGVTSKAAEFFLYIELKAVDSCQHPYDTKDAKGNSNKGKKCSELIYFQFLKSKSQ